MPIESRPFLVRETHLGTGETFPYIECGECGTVQIVNIPDDRGRYYPPFERHPVHVSGRLRRFLQRQRAAAVLGSRSSVLGRFLLRTLRPPDWARWLGRTGASPDTRILDVGSSDGTLLVSLEAAGFRHLTGIDPFITRDLTYPGGVRVFRRSVDDHEGEYDLIMLHHSLHHMPDPVAGLRRVKQLLHPTGTVIVRVPTAGNYGWRTYGQHWSSLAAPRHVVVPTVEGMRRMAAAAGFRIESTVFDGQGYIYALSEQLRAGILLSGYSQAKRAASMFSKRELAAFRALAAERNAAGDGDAAAFYLKLA